MRLVNEPIKPCLIVERITALYHQIGRIERIVDSITMTLVDF